MKAERFDACFRESALSLVPVATLMDRRRRLRGDYAVAIQAHLQRYDVHAKCASMNERRNLK